MDDQKAKKENQTQMEKHRIQDAKHKVKNHYAYYPKKKEYEEQEEERELSPPYDPIPSTEAHVPDDKQDSLLCDVKQLLD